MHSRITATSLRPRRDIQCRIGRLWKWHRHRKFILVENTEDVLGRFCSCCNRHRHLILFAPTSCKRPIRMDSARAAFLSLKRRMRSSWETKTLVSPRRRMTGKARRNRSIKSERLLSRLKGVHGLPVDPWVQFDVTGILLAHIVLQLCSTL